ncbi:hypothetical protein Glove_816420g2 [Diversispora epigaea]|uniref:Uncharacterized protein n=1 Tax=Diversispora epigaea TaxID=1348612 RepID=A0A397FXH9_9GLOM|nr:hypothetical protein Glove_816420g2 [Diversispora epigaea]
MSSEYREFTFEDSDDDVTETVTNDTFNNDTNMRSDASSLPSSFLNDFEGLDLTEERIDRYADETSSVVISATSTVISPTTPIASSTTSTTSTIPKLLEEGNRLQEDEKGLYPKHLLTSNAQWKLIFATF